MSRLCLVVACGLFLCGAPVAVAAQDPLTTEAVAVLAVNGRDVTEILLQIDRDRRLWLPAAALRKAGLQWHSARERNAGEGTLVDVESMTPRLKAAFDQRLGRVTIDAPPEMFGHTGIVGGRDEAIRPRNTALFVNYAATAATGGGRRLTTEAGVSRRGVLLAGSLSVSPFGWVRGGTNATFDNEVRMVRWQIGDTLAQSAFFGAVVPVMGMTFSREFSIAPLFSPQDPIVLGGGTAVPATAEVYVNGRLVARTEIPAGVFDVRGLQVPAGPGHVRVIVRDDFGRTQEFSTNYYRSPRLLATGLHSFRYTAGVPRTDARTHAWHYDGFAGAAEHRFGVRPGLTIGGAMEFAAAGMNGGLDVAARLPMGEVEVDWRVGRTRGKVGQAAHLSYLWRGPRVRGLAALTVASDGFGSPNRPASAPAPRIASNAAIDVPLPRAITVGLRHTYLERPGGYVERRAGAAASIGLGGTASVSASIARVATGARRGREAFVVLTVSMGSLSHATVSAASTGDTSSVAAAVQRALPVGPGVGYRVQTQDGSRASALATLQLQGSVGRIEVGTSRHGPTSSQNVTVSGAVVAIDGGWHVTRPIGDSFGLVKTGEVGGVRTYVNNQLVGRTNRRGEIIAPNFGSYVMNRVAIDDRDMPFTYDVPAADSLVLPGLRTGSVVSFIARPMHTVEGVFVAGPAGSETPVAFGTAQAQWPTGVERVPLGRHGEFRFDQAGPGQYEIRLAHGSRDYRCPLIIAPVTRTAPQLLGRISCREIPDEERQR